MKPNSIPFGLLLMVCFSASGVTRYVNVSNSHPAAPYTSWASAAMTIQEAVDAAESGETILVTNGVYATGGRAVHGTLTNRVAVDKPVHLLSVNGPQFTVIQGYQVPGITNGDGAIRCVYLTNGASLSGFTLTNGATRATNDYVRFQESSGGGVHCEALQSYLDPPTVVSNCIIAGNSAFGPGGGVYGGGVSSAQIIDCELRGNTAQIGGGVAEGWVIRCLIADNAAENGGGASEAYGEAGGFEYYSCKLDNCLLVGNRAQFNGGGAYACDLSNCTVAGNSAGQTGGGLYGFFVIQVQAPSRAVNSIVYSNTAPRDANFVGYACNLDNSCAVPLPDWGSGNITNAPSFVDFAGGNFRLQANSPCINTGTNYCAPAPFDLDGNPRVRGGLVDMGAFEFQQGSTGLVHYVNLLNANPVSPYLSWPTAATNIQDAIDAAIAGDEIVVSNGVYSVGGRLASGMTNRVVVDKALNLRSVNGPEFTVIEGYQVPSTTNGVEAVRCVYFPASGASLTGFTLTNGATRTNISYLLEYTGGGTLGGSLSNCVLVGNAATVGGGAYQANLYNCRLVRNSAMAGGGAVYAKLQNCLVVSNSAWGGGGGVSQCTLTDCTVSGNSAASGGGAYMSTINRCVVDQNSAQSGGGTQASALYNTLVRSNSAVNGGGVIQGQMFNCTVVWNSATTGGGVYSLSNLVFSSIVYFNAAANGSNYFVSNPWLIQVEHTCTSPLLEGNGNIELDPWFRNSLAGDFHLRPNSPCVDSGDGSFGQGETDLDGNRRFRGAGMDMGAYEFQGSEPVLKVAKSAGGAVLSWPQWASDFLIQQIGATPMTSAGWSNLVADPVIMNNENSVSVPLEGTQRLFRLFKP